MIEKIVHRYYECRKARLQRRILSLREKIENQEKWLLNQQNTKRIHPDSLLLDIYYLKGLNMKLDSAEQKYFGISDLEIATRTAA